MLISTNSGLYSARPNELRAPMAEAMDFFGRMGFEAVDVNFAATIYDEPEKHEPILDGDWQQNLDTVLAAIRRNNLVVSHTHLPFYNYEMEDKERLAFCDQMTCRAIDASAYIGAKYAVIHPQRDAEKHTLIDRTVALLTPFNEYAKARGVTLCVENMYTTYPEELREIVDRMACGACWDVGHANFGKHPQYEGMTLLGKRIRVLHLHDNYGTRDDHSMPYFGTIDWDEIMRALRDIGYEGTFNYEVAATHLPMALREDHARYLVDAARLLLGR